MAMFSEAAPLVTKMMPANGAVDVNPDTHLTLTFSEEVMVGEKGFVSIYDKQTGKLVDRLDLSIPAGPAKGQPANPLAQYTPVPYIYKPEHITNRTTKPGTPSGVNAWDTGRYQLDIIGGFSDGFHFYPVIVHGQQATIYLHHNMLEYGHEYYVTIDKGVLEGFDGIKGKKGWTFRTKTAPPSPAQRRLVVAADGSGDFSTVQGAMDFIPDFLTSESDRYTVFVKNGDYEELVYFRNKRFVTIEGESCEGVLVHYPNNEVFNPHPADIKTNEVKGTFPSRRAAFAADNSTDLIFRNITLKTDCKGQAEGLLVNGERNFFENVHIIGDGDALQANGSCYWLNCRIDGGGDTILGRGPSFFNHCTITSYGAFMWIRNTEENHGNVFIDCCFKGLSAYAELGRLPDNKGKNYPHAECVLINCELEGIPASGWGKVDEGATTATLLEFNSHDPQGRPIDVSQRHPLLRQLDPFRDAELIGRYSDSHWVLGWCPVQPLVSSKSDEQMLRDWIKVIASDEFGGRKPMSPFEDKTVNYLAQQLEEIGLEPAFNGSWFQPFELISVTAKPQGSKLTVKGRQQTELHYPDDVVVWTARATDKVVLPKAEYVFVGFGIHAPEYGWDDYADIDVKGKIVIAMVNDPGYYDAQLFRGRNMTYYGRWIYKFEEARRQGAAGCLVLHNTEAASYGWHVCVNGHMEDNLAIYNPDTRNADELAIKGWLREEGASKLFSAAGMNMAEALAAAKRPGFKSFSLKVKGDVRMAVSYNIQQTRNVGAILRGTDKADEAVVMNAHWDHLGIGKPDEHGDSIYNGAADNASGMASALLVAKKFKALHQRPRRSVLFLFPSSEESGLFGSEYYCNHPVIPMEKTSACLNFESIGPAELTHDVVILGGGETDLDQYYVAAAATQGRTIFFDDDNSDGWFFRSDHYNFVKKGVRAVVVENGLKPVDPSRPNKYPMPVWYHKPSDEYHDDWDLSGTLANTNLIFSVGLSLVFIP